MKSYSPCRNTKMYYILAILLLFGAACDRKSREHIPVNPEFSRYVTAYTSGMISSTSSIKVLLAENYKGFDSPEEVDANTLFSFSPDIEGEALWKDARTLEFIPAERLLPGKLYNAKLFLNKIMDVDVAFKVFRFQFQTYKQAFSTEIEGLETRDVKQLKFNRLTGFVRSADFASGVDVANMLEANQGSESLNVKWDHDGTGTEHRFTIDSVIRSDKTGMVLLQWKGNSIGVKEGYTDTVEVPALGDFKIIDVTVIQQPDQYVRIRFSDPIKSDQDLLGLISLDNASSMRFEINRNLIKAYPVNRQHGQLKLLISRGILNIAGFKFEEGIEYTVKFEDFKPAVRFLGKGNIIPSPEGLVLPFEAVNLRSVDVGVIRIFENNIMQFLQNNNIDGDDELKRVGRPVYFNRIDLAGDKISDPGKWNTFSLDLQKLFDQEPGAIYQVYLSFKKDYSLYKCDDENNLPGEMKKVETDDRKPPYLQDDYWDNPYRYWYSYYLDDFDWRERDNPCHSSYYNNDRFIKRNILATNLGLVAKAGKDNKILCVVSDLSTAKPVEGVQLSIYNYQQQLIKQVISGSDGMAEIDLPSKAFLLVASKNKQKSYLRLDDGNSLSLSKYDVSGSVVQEGIKGFIYTERGVWRPGDSLYVMFILEDKDKMFPEEHPVVFELSDPRGRLMKRVVKSDGLNGFYDFRTSTSVDAPTGNWMARIIVGGAIFSKRLKIEAIKPNRLKLDLDFGQEIIIGDDEDLQGTLEVKWLHGAPARNLRADVKVILRPATTKFDGYKDYIFDDPVRKYHPEESIIFDDQLDAGGKAAVNVPVPVNRSAPGFLKADFIMRAFEAGGNFSTSYLSLPYSPFEYYNGLKRPDGSGYYSTLVCDSTYEFKVASVDATGKAVSRDKLKVTVYKIHWRWWWEAGSDNLASYVGSSRARLVHSEEISTVDGKGKFNLKIPYPEWGRFLVRVSDPEGGHSTGQILYYDWPQWASRSGRENPGGATMLTFSSDKPEYSVGEKAEISFPSGGLGRALVSIETGSKVMKAWWVEPQKPETKLQFEIEPDMAPNIYVHITLIQPHNQTANDLPIRMYGVIPILVSDEATRLRPEIDMPDELAPEKTFEIKISEENKKAMTYTVAVVDEGLLDLTRFRTPDPWPYMYAREALGVKTWDLYDYVMGAYGGKLEQLFAIGGDEDVDGKGKQKINRFKAVVEFLGPFELKKGETASHKVTLPDYIGSVRTMVIAGQDRAYGSAEKTTAVKKPLMVLATLPRVLGPGEETSLPVTVFAMDDKIKNVDVKLEVNDLFEIVGVSVKKLRFNEVGDQVVYFNLKVKNSLGKATAKVVVSSGNQKSQYKVELEVRNPNPYISNVIEKSIEGGGEVMIDYESFGTKGTNDGSIEVSGIPPIDFGRRLKYLISYPHGCVEQVTSSVFPQLYLDNFIETNEDFKKITTHNIKAAINRLLGFQQNNGGLTYWPGASYANDWGTSYAGHFMLEAEKKGYELPAGFKRNWVKYQKTQAARWRRHSNDRYYYYSDFAQAYRLYTLALAGKAQFGAMNRLKEQRTMSVQAKWRLAAAYALAGKKEVAEEIISDLTSSIQSYYDPYTYGSSARDQAMIIETLSLLDDRDRATPLVIDLSKDLSSGYWMSTQTTAFSLIAIAKFMKSDESPSKGMSFTMDINGEKENLNTTFAMYQEDIDLEKVAKGKIIIRNNGKSIIFARLLLRGKPLESSIAPMQNNLGIEVEYLSLDDQPIDVNSLQQGVDIKAVVSIENPGLRKHYYDLALTQVFPSGWEILNTRIADFSSLEEKDKPDYKDIRDDRIYSYFNLRKYRTVKFVVLLNAAYAGYYYLPPVSCEAMYDNSINAVTAGKWVRVTRETATIE